MPTQVATAAVVQGVLPGMGGAPGSGSSVGSAGQPIGLLLALTKAS